MAPATPVTMSIMSRESGSRRKPKSTWSGPTASQENWQSGRTSHPVAPIRTTLSPNPASTAAMERPALSERLR